MRASRTGRLSTSGTPTHMTHGHVLELAGRIAQHGTAVLRQCRGIPVAALRRYLNARKAQCDAWSQMLVHTVEGNDQLGTECSLPSWETIAPALEEISTSAILLRVASTALHGIGQQLDIPLAIDVATQSARAFDGIVQRAIGFVALRSDFSCSQLMPLERLGQMADRVSDLLCGALLPAYQCDRYFVDRERARDFAETFGRDPNLVRVPIQQFGKRLPRELLSVCQALEVERSLVACLPILTSVQLSHPEKTRPVSQIEKPVQAMGLRVVGPSESDPAAPKGQKDCLSKPVLFPNHSFARSRQRLRDSGRG